MTNKGKSNTSTAVTKAVDYQGDTPINDYLKKYKVYPSLTSKLDRPDLHIDQSVVNEIVLWKVARYVEISEALLRALEALRSLKPKEHRKGEEVLEGLLGLKGVRLPMASTFMRFANPAVFQILDRHMYRAVYGGLYKNPHKNPLQCKHLYSGYLDDLRSLCDSLKIRFEMADRILFEYDKAINGSLPDNRATIG